MTIMVVFALKCSWLVQTPNQFGANFLHYFILFCMMGCFCEAVCVKKMRVE